MPDAMPGVRPVDRPLQQPPMSDDLFEAAIGYLARGLPIIALTGKAPNVRIHPHGLTAPITPGWGPTAIAQALSHKDTTGIGLVIPYPYFVIDIDGEEGAETWRDLVGLDHFMPERWVAKTGRGLHLWFSNIEPTPSMKLGTLLDLKGQGGYVAAPPSIHPDGHRYTWLLEPGDDAPMEAPLEVLARIRDHNFNVERAMTTKQANRRIRHQPFEDGKLWASFGFDHLYDGMRAAGEGNRNSYLHWAAATMAEEGATEDEFTLLKAAAKDAGLTSLETRRTVKSGRTRG